MRRRRRRGSRRDRSMVSPYAAPARACPPPIENTPSGRFSIPKPSLTPPPPARPSTVRIDSMPRARNSCGLKLPELVREHLEVEPAGEAALVERRHRLAHVALVRRRGGAGPSRPVAGGSRSAAAPRSGWACSRNSSRNRGESQRCQMSDHDRPVDAQAVEQLQRLVSMDATSGRSDQLPAFAHHRLDAHGGARLAGDVRDPAQRILDRRSRPRGVIALGAEHHRTPNPAGMGRACGCRRR